MSPERETEEVVEKPKRTPRKRAPKVLSEDAVDTAPITRAPRKTAPRKRVAKKVTQTESEEEREPARKAPTVIATDRVTKKKSRRQGIVVTLLLIIGVGASAGVGFTDKGGINVNEVIENRNERIRRGEIQDVIVPVQNTNPAPDGGLIQLSPEEIAKYEAEQRANQATAASSTPPATASSTAPTGNVPLSNEEAAAVAEQAQ